MGYDPDDHIPKVPLHKTPKPSTSKASEATKEGVVEIVSDTEDSDADEDFKSEWTRVVNERRRKNGKKPIKKKTNEDSHDISENKNKSENDKPNYNRREDFDSINQRVSHNTG